MKKKIFAVSDIHGHYMEWKLALDEAGFSPDNKEHLLIVCGDFFDRGDENVSVFNYLNSIQNKIQFPPYLFLFHRNKDFNAASEVSLHQIGTADKVFRRTVVSEPEDSGMFQKTVKDTDNCNIFRQFFRQNFRV